MMIAVVVVFMNDMGIISSFVFFGCNTFSVLFVVMFLCVVIRVIVVAFIIPIESFLVSCPCGIGIHLYGMILMIFDTFEIPNLTRKYFPSFL